MKTWADMAKVSPPGSPIDRDAGEGPPRCCTRRLVAADALVCYDDLPGALLAVVKERFPAIASMTPIYLCDGCSDTLVREGVITREERAAGLGLSAASVLKARELDQLDASRGT